MIATLDEHVGRVLHALQAADVADRTLVVFTSDNGTTHPADADSPFHVGGVDARFFNSTAGLRGYKGSVYEGGLRVPAIVCLPGKIKAKSVCDAPSYFADWFPTLCEAVGLKLPDALDGESLWPLLCDKVATLPHKPMIWVFPEYGGQVAVRLGDYKVVRQKLSTSRPGDWEVYDLAKDEAEQHNLAQSHAHVIAEAKVILRREVSENKRFPLVIPGVNDPAN